MILKTTDIPASLTKRQKDCILALSGSWQDRGYSKVEADILWAIGGSAIYGVLPELVECTYLQEPNRSPHYAHRLTDEGLRVQRLLQAECELA